MSTSFVKLSIEIDAAEALSVPRRLMQVSDVHNRDRYKYTHWQKESAPPTPLLIYALPDDVVGRVLAQLPDALLEREVPGVYLMRMPKPCVDSRSLPPHVDRGRRAAINIYLKCAGETTEFYDPDDSTKTLKPTGSFTAKPGEAWLLDVSKPHAVLMRDADERVGLSMSFRHARYAELASILEGA